jgi:uncharacterized protein YPO0396
MDSRLTLEISRITSKLKKEFGSQKKELEEELEFLTKENKRLQFLLKDAIATNKNLRLKVRKLAFI